MLKRLSVLLCICAFGLTAAGCSKCDVPTWGYASPSSCHGTAPVN